MKNIYLYCTANNFDNQTSGGMMKPSRRGGTGIHAALKMLWEQSRVGSTPTSGIEQFREFTTKMKQNLVDLVNYQDGSIVSREILKKPTGTITVFAFAQGQGLSQHTAPFDAAVYILDGEAEVKIAGKIFKVKKGEFIIMPANKPHSLKAVQKFKMLLIMIK